MAEVRSRAERLDASPHGRGADQTSLLPGYPIRRLPLRTGRRTAERECSLRRRRGLRHARLCSTMATATEGHPTQEAEPTMAPSKDKIVAGILALFLGGLGIHQFYLGNAKRGLLYLLFSWTLIPALIALIDAIRIFTTSDADWLLKYPPMGQAAAAGQPEAASDPSLQLQRYAKMHAEGHLTDEEFEEKKRQLLAK